MTTLEIKTDLRLKIKDKSAQKLVAIYENNQAKLQAGSDLEDGLILNDVVVSEMKRRLNIINVNIRNVNVDLEVYKIFKALI
jgi:hypothetical protein